MELAQAVSRLRFAKNFSSLNKDIETTFRIRGESGAAAGLICGPSAPIYSGIGIFIGGAVGAFVASGGYDWLTSK